MTSISHSCIIISLSCGFFVAIKLYNKASDSSIPFGKKLPLFSFSDYLNETAPLQNCPLARLANFDKTYIFRFFARFICFYVGFRLLIFPQVSYEIVRKSIRYSPGAVSLRSHYSVATVTLQSHSVSILARYGVATVGAEAIFCSYKAREEKSLEKNSLNLSKMTKAAKCLPRNK